MEGPFLAMYPRNVYFNLVGDGEKLETMAIPSKGRVDK